MTLSPQGKIELNVDALTFIRSIQKNISAISIIGPYRSGKSYLLNRIAGQQKGFSLGGSTNPCTQGVWIWGEPISLASDGSQTLLFDTEGLFALNRDDKFDTALFLFSALASSLLIYNCIGLIDEKALERLAFIGNLGSYFTNGGKKTGNPPKNSAQIFENFPSFLWLLRDFSLDLALNEKGARLSADEYLEYALMPRPPKSKPQDPFTKKHMEPLSSDGLRNSLYANSSDQERNQIRRAIKSTFKDRGCTTLIRPVNEESLLRKVDDLPISELRPKFNEEIDGLITRIGNLTHHKRVNGRPLNGEHFAAFLIYLAETLNSSELPTFDNFSVILQGYDCKTRTEKSLRMFHSDI
jgi:hypothetical protein